ncbi:MAG: prenyltransferase [Prevotella sp.]|jgi:1,4-dihydroxy-2-naphthoate octaprenyltransferase|nr:prenyltransferase [Prevotella sp.]
MNIIRFWVKNARIQALPQSVLPAILAFCLSIPFEGFSFPLGIIAILGVICGHLGLNLFDDYFDYKKKKCDYRDAMVHEGFRARIGKCTYLTSGQATVRNLLIACCVFSFIALLIGVVILYYRGAAILYFMLLTAVLGISYSGAPLRFSYHGLGELLIGFMFGPMVMTGLFYSACGVINPMIVLVSIPVGLLVANILYVHSIMDFEPDKKIGKHTLAVLLNNPRLMLIALAVILFSPYLIIGFGIVKGYLSTWFILLGLTLPMAISLFYMMIVYIKNPQQKFSPSLWMGPMNNWQRLEVVGIDWFMIRWYLARNLLSFFCLIIMILSFIV